MALKIVKMRQGMSYSCKEKTIILNVFKYFRTIHPDKCVTEIVRRTAKATGCSEKSIFQFRKEEASEEGFKEPSKTKVRKNININSRFIKYDESVRQAIRSLIYDLKYRNIVPSLNTLLKNINADDKLPNFSVMTLRRLLKDMGFYYEKVGNKAILVENSDQSSDIKKENFPCGYKPYHNNATQQIMPSSNNINNIQIQTCMDAKPYPLPQNNIQPPQMCIPNYDQKRFSIPLSHQENMGLDTRFVSSNVIPHQMHSLPPNLKQDGLSYAHLPPNPLAMGLQQ